VSGKIGIGVIGVGTFGALHAQTYRQLDGCELRAVADVDESRLEAVSEALQVHGYDDYRDLLKRSDVDAVSICTTDEFHVEPAIAAVSAGKHVLIEKPLATSPPDCDEIIGAAEDSGVKLMVGHILRFDPRYHAAYSAIKDGKLGDLVHMFSRRNNSMRSAKRLSQHTSVLFFLGIHDIDFMNWCTGARVESVYAEATAKVLEGTPDTVLALLRYAGGTIASLEVSWVLPEAHPRGLDARFDAVGSAGAVYVNGVGDDVSIVHERLEHPPLFYASELFGERVGILRDELNHFVRCVLHDREPIVGGRDGKAAVEVAYAIQQSYESGLRIQLPQG
jgi:UDP-N-acetylglucosamine 3-dehydrogenase